MKKVSTILAAAALLFATSAFAAKGPEKVSAVVKKAFEKQFTPSSSVTWEKAEEFYFASFKLNDRDVSVAYNIKGELVGASRVISADELPMAVSMAIAEKYAGYTAGKTATEVTYDGQSSYYITLENAKQTLSVKCFSDGDINVINKTKK